MTWKLIWLVGLFVASLIYAQVLVEAGDAFRMLGWGPIPDYEGPSGILLVDVVHVAAFSWFWPVIGGGIAFAIMKLFRRGALTALLIATGLLLMSFFAMLL